MDGLFNLCGPRVREFEHEGRVYKFSVRTLADYAAFESFLLKRTRNPYIGIDELPETIQAIAAAAAATEAARPQIITVKQSEAFCDTYLGRGYRVWQSLSVNHPGEFPPHLPAEEGAQLGIDFMEWVGPERTPELLQILDEVDEDDILKNSDGRQAMAATS